MNFETSSFDTEYSDAIRKVIADLNNKNAEKINSMFFDKWVKMTDDTGEIEYGQFMGNVMFFDEKKLENH